MIELHISFCLGTGLTVGINKITNESKLTCLTRIISSFSKKCYFSKDNIRLISGCQILHEINLDVSEYNKLLFFILFLKVNVWFETSKVCHIEIINFRFQKFYKNLSRIYIQSTWIGVVYLCKPIDICKVVELLSSLLFMCKKWR